MDEVLLVINSGSSSIKFALYTCADLKLQYQGKIESVFEKPQFSAVNSQQQQIINESLSSPGYASLLTYLLDWLHHLPQSFTLKAVGHRVVHGGTIFYGPCLVNADRIKEIASLTPLAPLHQPHNVLAIESIEKIYPGLPQVACFDTTFHQTQELLAMCFALPRNLTEEGVIRYGFHGISYEYIASVLPQELGSRVVVAHLGNGASLCAMKNGKSVATTMGFTTLDGLVMGSRCGTLDPGVILYLLQEKRFSAEQINKLLYAQSGLLGVSGISTNMHDLQSSSDPHAMEAVNLFCYRAAKELCGLLADLHGCDALIFTAGIGENSAFVRKKICEHLEWLGVILDEHANSTNALLISDNKSAILVGVIPTNEEYMIARHTLQYIT